MAKINDSLIHLLDHDEFTDCTFELEDNNDTGLNENGARNKYYVPAHKLILSAASPAFKILLNVTIQIVRMM